MRQDRLRSSGNHPLLEYDTKSAAVALHSIGTLLHQCRRALELIGITDLDSWSFYAYCRAAKGCPKQENHRDQPEERPRHYFTFLLPLTSGAELTQFCLGQGLYRTFPGMVMFHGHVLHRGPAVGQRTRIVLALVASATTGINREVPSPLCSCKSNWERCLVKNKFEFHFKDLIRELKAGQHIVMYYSK